MTPLGVLAFVLLIVGVIGCVAPRLPGITASMTGVYLYWWTTGYSEPSTVLLAVVTVIGLVAALSSVVADAVSTRIGGASTTTLLIAGAVGSILLVFTGPIAMFLGSTLIVFVLEYRRQRDVRAGARAAIAVVVSSLGSRIFRLSLAIVILLLMLLTILF